MRIEGMIVTEMKREYCLWKKETVRREMCWAQYIKVTRSNFLEGGGR